MKCTHLILAMALVALTACRIIDPPNNHAHRAALTDVPETVMVTYHVQAGQEAVFAALLGDAWKIYRHERVVQNEPHVIIQSKDEDGKPKFVEIFTWVNHAAPDKTIPAIQTIWGQEMGYCEGRNGHHPIEGGEVIRLAP